MLFRAVVIVMLSSVLVIEVTGEVDRRISRAQHAIRSETANRWRAQACNDNRATSELAADSRPTRTNRLGDQGESILVDIRRDELDRLLSRTDLASQARIVPTFHGDTAIGVKLFAIQPDSLFAALGLQNGDLVTTINDQPVTGAAPDRFVTPRDRATFADITGRRDGHWLRIIVLVHP